MKKEYELQKRVKEKFVQSAENLKQMKANLVAGEEYWREMDYKRCF